jgi:hypothetical protein
MSRKELIDGVLSKWISRKLMVFIVSAVALFLKAIESGDFMVISVIYIGTQAAADVAIALKNSKNMG